ncbi:hypothetical protein [Geosporobacter ferrireducens]|uniref:Uncharacterized protein n=1 Tax=Geosporobacter ferrireducens TaxID=1424294 RepID=A0A1D8GFN9_9FIRM|nr:hypothetical protein [Geosporobacter ferrireducens]AOT69729.1 hypothetical protein Gferi_09120 [Geosporobacter ferrireducens]MTI54562.1 hypothetical protein [Geosporobacter ferrireducens]
MSYIFSGNRKVVDEDIKKIIQETTEFDVTTDISTRTKREDVLAFILQCDADALKQDIEAEDLEIDIESDEEAYISELMNKADEYAVEIEENLPEDLLAYYYAYEYDEDEGVIKTILVVSSDELGELKLREVGNRLITVVGD